MPATKSTPKRRASRKRYEPISELIGNFDGKVDVESKLVTEVALLGAKSRNGRVYTEQALQQAAGCLEGAKVFINHREPAGNSRSFRPHDVRDYVGRVQGVYVDESDMVRARRFVVHNQEHWPLVEVAKSDPSAFGFSIDGLAQVKAGEVLSVKEIASVDLVAQPATVSGLFEHSGDNDMEIKNLTEAELREARSDLVDAIEKPISAKLKEQEVKVTALQKQLDELREASRNGEIDALLTEFAIEDVPADLREQLLDLGAEKARKLLELRGDAPEHKTGTGGKKPQSRKPGSDTVTESDVDLSIEALEERWAEPTFR